MHPIADDRVSRCVIASLLVHAALLVGLASFPGEVAAAAEESPEDPQRYTLVPYLVGSETAQEDSHDPGILEPQGGAGLGSEDAADADARYGVMGSEDNPDPHIARVQAPPQPTCCFPSRPLRDEPPSGDALAPVAQWGRDDAFGQDARSASGRMWGPEIGAAKGTSESLAGNGDYDTLGGGDGRVGRSSSRAYTCHLP